MNVARSLANCWLSRVALWERAWTVCKCMRTIDSTKHSEVNIWRRKPMINGHNKRCRMSIQSGRWTATFSMNFNIKIANAFKRTQTQATRNKFLSSIHLIVDKNVHSPQKETKTLARELHFHKVAITLHLTLQHKSISESITTLFTRCFFIRAFALLLWLMFNLLPAIETIICDVDTDEIYVSVWWEHVSARELVSQMTMYKRIDFSLLGMAASSHVR